MGFELNAKLSEFIGVVIGDGCLYGNFNKYVILLTGNVKSDSEYYENVQKSLGNIGVNSVLKVHWGGLRLIVNNKKLFLFLKDTLGMSYEGKKTYEVSIPDKIFDSEENLKSCIRGIFNADGSIFTSNKRGSPNYPSIEITTVSKRLATQLNDVLKDLELRVRMRFYHDSRSLAEKTYRIALNGYEMMRKWCEEIGFSHPVKTAKFNEIMMGREGFEPPTARSSVECLRV